MTVHICIWPAGQVVSDVHNLRKYRAWTIAYICRCFDSKYL